MEWSSAVGLPAGEIWRGSLLCGNDCLDLTRRHLKTRNLFIPMDFTREITPTCPRKKY